jgi:hypothetical protein
MFLDLNDPRSIVEWWRVWPERHSAFLTHKLTSSPQFAPCIREAQRMISDLPELKAIWATSVRERLAREALDAEQAGNVPAHELRWRELATAA